MSYPYNKSSVNSGIPEEFSSVKYQSVQDDIDIILDLGPNTFMAKSDIKSAFRLIPIHPTDYRLFGFKFDGKFYFDKCLEMGCASSCAIFESFTTAIHWVLKTKLHVEFLVHFVDDFLLLHSSEIGCKSYLTVFENFAKSINLPLAPDKTVGPSTVLTFLGFELSSDSGGKN